jgi:hypothetical protein
MIRGSIPSRRPATQSKVRIDRCSDRLYWYADMIGQTVPIEFVDAEGYWAREHGPFHCINVIRHEDATILPAEN